MTEQPESQPETKKEEIAIIGGGLGGCLTALMLAKSSKYHVTLIEAQDTLLNGASAIASRLHLGGEYPVNAKTAHDCLMGALAWRLIMPNQAIDPAQDNIYTPTPPMKFLVGQKTQKHGETHPDDEKSLTVDKQFANYEVIRKTYEKEFKRIQETFGWDEEHTAKVLFGSYKEGEFFRTLKPEEFSDYIGVAGGFQSHEIGLNVPKYLAMIQKELETQEKQGNISILKGHRVKKEGIEGEDGNFTIRCNYKGKPKDIHASQIVQAAWQGGPAIVPHLGHADDKDKIVRVYKRGMLLVDLPNGLKTPPAFIMLGDDGGMFAPYNDRVAICYLPTEEAAYRKDYSLSKGEPSLPRDWNKLEDTDRTKWTETYFRLLKKRFPFLEKASNPRLIIRDTLNFEEELSARKHAMVHEVRGKLGGMQQSPMQVMEMRQWNRPNIMEVKKGLFTLYPTKATYAVHAALQAVEMVNKRSQDRNADEILPEEDMLGLILSHAPNNLNYYSLGQMKEANIIEYARFFGEHKDLSPYMLKDSWHTAVEPDVKPWAEQVRSSFSPPPQNDGLRRS